jgi:hypothetical protein
MLVPLQISITLLPSFSLFLSASFELISEIDSKHLYKGKTRRRGGIYEGRAAKGRDCGL